jgi:hypothetical protein
LITPGASAGKNEPFDKLLNLDKLNRARLKASASEVKLPEAPTQLFQNQPVGLPKIIKE